MYAIPAVEPAPPVRPPIFDDTEFEADEPTLRNVPPAIPVLTVEEQLRTHSARIEYEMHAQMESQVLREDDELEI